MEHAGDIGLVALEHGADSIIRVKRVSICNVNKDFLDSLAILKDAFLCKSPRVIIELRIDNNTGNTVNQCADKLIHAGLESGNGLTNGTNGIGSVLASGNSVVVFKAGIVSDCVNNAHAMCVERTSKGHSRHRLILLKKFIKFCGVIFIGAGSI